jgi:FMN reductase
VTTIHLAVITAGVTQPSSTRLLADRLTEATVRALAPSEVVVEVIDVRDLAHQHTKKHHPGVAGTAQQVRRQAKVEAHPRVVAPPHNPAA